jgi:hypothetical protein
MLENKLASVKKEL